MDRHQYLVNEYKMILTLSEHMLALAQEEKWDELVELEVSYLKAVEATTILPLSEEVAIGVQNLIRLHLRRILDNETQIKILLQARMQILAELIGQSVKQQEVNTTYGRFTNREIAMRDQQ
ncbi:flagella biosynthesis regulatory protein FliT [Ewingella sp. S1.OA.A_B6]